MGTQKRSHQGLSAPRDIHNDDVPSPATKKLKSSHARANGTFAAILDTTPKKLHASLTNGVTSKAASQVDESKATIAAHLNGSNGTSVQNAIEIEEDESESSDDDSDLGEISPPTTNGVASATTAPEDVTMTNGGRMNIEEEEADDAPSFADLLKARNPDVVDVSTKATGAHPASASKSALTRPLAGLSLATVLQQALKTDDKEMLEKCLALRDLQAIKNTVQRLPSPMATDLLTRIAERVHKRPGRTGALMLWIQWTLVFHGGYLAAQPDVIRKLRSLNQVIRQRAQGLVPLVQLKGKLDLLSAQLEMRKSAAIAAKSRIVVPEEDEGVLYIDGEGADDWSEDEPVGGLVQGVQENAHSGNDDADGTDEDEFDPPPQDLSEEEDEEIAEQEGLLDIEAEETDDDEEEEGEEEQEGEDEDEDDEVSEASGVDVDMDEDSSEEASDEDIQPPKPHTMARKR